MKKIGVLQVIGGGEFGGAERHLLTLMRLIDPAKYDPVLLCLCEGPFADLCRQEGIKTYEIVMAHKLDLKVVEPIQNLIRENNIDIVHTHGVRANLVARMAGRKEALPIITTFHSVLRYDYQSAWEAYVARFLTRLTNSRSDRFIAVSRAIRDDLRTMNIPDSKIEVIYNGLDIKRLIPANSPDAIKKSLGLTSGAKVIAVVGRLHPVKGQVYFLQAASRLLEKYDDLVFLLVGEGPSRPEIEQQIKDLHLSEKVIMTGFYPNVSDLYPIIDVLCLPSLMEGMGLVLLEAMHFGVPAVASRVGGISEIITDGQNGLLVQPKNPVELADKIAQMLDDPGTREKYVTNGRSTVQSFSVENMARKTEAVYERFI